MVTQNNGEAPDPVTVTLVECSSMPQSYRFSIGRHHGQSGGDRVAILISPGYDPEIVAIHAAMHRPADEQEPIRIALGLPAPIDPVTAARRALRKS